MNKNFATNRLYDLRATREIKASVTQKEKTDGRINKENKCDIYKLQNNNTIVK